MGFNPLFAALFFSGDPHPPRCAVMLATGEGQVGVPITNGSTWMASRSFRPMVAGQASSAAIAVSGTLSISLWASGRYRSPLRPELARKLSAVDDATIKRAVRELLHEYADTPVSLADDPLHPTMHEVLDTALTRALRQLPEVAMWAVAYPD